MGHDACYRARSHERNGREEFLKNESLARFIHVLKSVAFSGIIVKNIKTNNQTNRIEWNSTCSKIACARDNRCRPISWRIHPVHVLLVRLSHHSIDHQYQAYPLFVQFFLFRRACKSRDLQNKRSYNLVVLSQSITKVFTNPLNQFLSFQKKTYLLSIIMISKVSRNCHNTIIYIVLT